jgi:hypothetical protein
MNIDDLVSRYIALRDKKAEHKAEYDGKVAKVDELLRRVEGVLLKHFQDTGVESVRTESGTAYTSTRTSAKVADWDSFIGFVRESDSWDMLEHRCAKTVVEEYKNENGDLPPGLNWTSEVTVGIRRSK